MVEDGEFVVVARVPRTATILEVALAPAGEALHYEPGQYVVLGDRGHLLPPRSYSIANAPHCDGQLTVLVTRVEGGETSTWIHDRLAVGDVVLVSGPYGTFVQRRPASRPVLALAGGSGLAPVRALAEEAVRRGIPSSFTVVFSARTRADLVDAGRFADWQRSRLGFRFVRTLTRAQDGPPPRRIPDLLPAMFDDLSRHEVFVAGTPGFVAACARACRDLGARDPLLHTEEFFADPHPWSSPVLAGARR